VVRRLNDRGKRLILCGLIALAVLGVIVLIPTRFGVPGW
jgi:uncharacterized membrane protein YhaH (DUF805 family)